MRTPHRLVAFDKVMHWYEPYKCEYKVQYNTCNYLFWIERRSIPDSWNNNPNINLWAFFSVGFLVAFYFSIWVCLFRWHCGNSWAHWSKRSSTRKRNDMQMDIWSTFAPAHTQNTLRFIIIVDRKCRKKLNYLFNIYLCLCAHRKWCCSHVPLFCKRQRDWSEKRPTASRVDVRCVQSYAPFSPLICRY